ncbi:site-specific DNA-methyltransferase [bacterium]|nr:site-specific DNA-methyltransferase [bacterium]
MQISPFTNSKLFKTAVSDFIVVGNIKIPRFTNSFWSSKQRQATSIHEVSYRACFKAELPRFFIELLTKEKDVVYDPFCGRGTTIVEAGLLGRKVVANDLNPLSQILCIPRFFVPSTDEIKDRLGKITIDYKAKAKINLSMFYHRKTEAEIVSLKNYLDKKQKNGNEDHIDNWIRMVATNRLTGHSKGFFSVYTLPPNQAVTPESQIKINKKLKQVPEYRDIRKIIIKKSKSLVRDLSMDQIQKLKTIGDSLKFFTCDAQLTAKIKPESVNLTVTSPHFLDVVNYSGDNWLRCWFNGIDSQNVDKSIKKSKAVDEWETMMFGVFEQLYRITKASGWVVFEVGEVRNGSINLEELLVPLGIKAGFECKAIIINSQSFTKTSNIWGVKNNSKGTNSNRIVMFHKS